MNNYYTPLSPEDLQRRATAQRLGQQQQQQLQGHNIGMANTSNQSGPHRESLPLDTPMTGGDSLDDIVRQNTHELQRRQSVPHPFPGQMSQSEADRRLSMMDFGNDNDAFQNFQYGTMSGSAASNMSQAYGNMPSDSGSYGQPNIMAMSDQNNFASLSPDMMGNMMDFSSLNMGQMSADPHALSLYSQPVMGDQYPPTNLNTNFSMDMNVDNGPLSATSTHTAGGISIKQDEDMMAADAAGFGAADNSSAPRPRAGNNLDAALVSFQSSLPPHLTREVSGSTSNLQSPTLVTSRTVSQIPATPTATATPMTPASMALGPREPPQKSVYSRTGFDMLRALWYVATRKSQKIQLGAVDMSCAFVVCDVSQNDCPIIYVSDNFQHLTGYSSYEIIGQNCRFLQAPDGMVEAGTKREFVENHAVYNLKKAIANGEEIQQSLINYRKGGKPFLNLLTMIPIPWDTDEIRYFIGFQIDLVECPDAISGHDASGIAINYKHSSVPQYIWTPPSSSQWEPENGQTLGIDDVSTLLQQFNPKGIASDWHKQSWDKMLLENADDMIHVLSLKGLFQYVSPSCKKIINWDMNELVGKPLSTICHPSDIVPVMRELKDAQPHTPVNIVFRAHQKKIGFIWFECHGTLWSEQGKGRKSIILVGRKRPVYSLLRDDLEANGGIGDSEIWSKMSTSGMLLFVSSNVRSLLDLHPADLEGTSMQDLMRKESRIEFGRTIEKARKGKIVSCKHDIQNRRGQVLQAQTTFYPGDGSPDVKPT
ncbi:PAS domain-containing protein, partial [Podospora didyma]